MPIDDVVTTPAAVTGGTSVERILRSTGGDLVSLAQPNAAGSGALVPTATDEGGGVVSLTARIVGGSVSSLPVSPSTPATYTISPATLGTVGTYSVGADVAVAGRARISWEVIYTGGGATAQAGYRVRVGHTASPQGIPPVIDTSIAVAGKVGSQNSYDRAIKLPVSGASAYTFVVDLDTSAGWVYAALDVVEIVKDTSFGVVSAKVGGGY